MRRAEPNRRESVADGLAARLMEVYQKGMETLTKTRTAGKQTITVKQVHVTGGQNVIADKVTTGERKRGRGRENDDTPRTPYMRRKDPKRDPMPAVADAWPD